MSEAIGPEAQAEWQSWIGREERAEDTLDVGRARALQATLDDPSPPLEAGDPLPPLWHWLYFWVPAPRSTLGPDGHPARGGFLPPIPLPRRMWAGSRLEFPGLLPLGARAARVSRIEDVQLKQGRSGPLAFVTVRHEIRVGDRLAVTDEHDIVYREAAARPASETESNTGEPAPAEADWQETVTPDPVLLFRYSALTFNGHRIHYDQPYATRVEGYPGLVVHGPLLATLMLEAARRALPERPVAGFAFRGLRPVFDIAAFAVAGRRDTAGESAEVWVSDPDGQLAMRGRIAFAGARASD